MSWAGLIGPLQPIAASAGLRGWYEALCGAAGDADSLGLAVLGGRLAATPGLAFSPVIRRRYGRCGPTRRQG